MRNGIDIFTSGQVAKLCGVAMRTVTKWCDTEKIISHRIPGSKDRRVYREDLLKFLQDHEMYIVYRSLMNGKSITTVGVDSTALRIIKKISESISGTDVVDHDSIVAMAYATKTPAALTIFDANLGISDIVTCANVLRQQYVNVSLAVLASDYTTDPDMKRLISSKISVMDLSTLSIDVPTLLKPQPVPGLQMKGVYNPPKKKQIVEAVR